MYALRTCGVWLWIVIVLLTNSNALYDTQMLNALSFQLSNAREAIDRFIENSSFHISILFAECFMSLKPRAGMRLIKQSWQLEYARVCALAF